MKEQNYSNHTKHSPLYHIGLLIITLAVLVLSIIFLVRSIQQETNILLATLLMLIALGFVMHFVLIRAFPLGVQNRAIRVEENLRHFAMTGKLLNKELTLAQIIALRFASDEEFSDLIERAVKNKMSNKEIKKEIKHWRADHDRV